MRGGACRLQGCAQRASTLLAMERCIDRRKLTNLNNPPHQQVRDRGTRPTSGSHWSHVYQGAGGGRAGWDGFSQLLRCIGIRKPITNWQLLAWVHYPLKRRLRSRTKTFATGRTHGPPLALGGCNDVCGLRTQHHVHPSSRTPKTLLAPAYWFKPPPPSGACVACGPWRWQ